MLDQVKNVNASHHAFLDERIFSYVESTPDKLAVIFDNESLSYKELSGYASLLAIELVKSGVVAGDYVIVLLPPGLEITASLLAIHMVGAVYVPLDVDHPLSSIEEKINALDAKTMFTTTSFSERFSIFSMNIILSDLLRKKDYLPFTDEVKRAGDNEACVFFTSGSSGKPKGVVGSYKAMFESITSPARFLRFTETDTLNSIARFTWSISMLELLAPLVNGGTSLILGRDRAQDLSKLYSSTLECTAFHCPPGLLKKLANHILEEGLDLPQSIRLVWYGGDLFSTGQIDTLHEAFPQAVVGTAYGCTEIFGLSHCYLYQRNNVNRVLIGKPVDSMTQLILSDKKEPVDVGSGELLLGGDRIATRYFGDVALTNEKFVVIEGERYFSTGDFVQLDNSGELSFLERRDDQVKVRGIRVELGEIEYVINSIRGVRDVAVLAVSDGGEDLEKQLQVYVSSKSEYKLKEEDVRESISEKLPSYMMPNLIFILDELPMTENFKIDKKKLIQLGKEYGLGGTSEFSTELEVRLANVWESLIKKKPSTVDDNFFNVGGDSLSAIHLASSITKEFSASVSVAEIYKNPKFLDQVKILQKMKQQEEPVKPIELTASLAQSGLFFREMFENKGKSITCTRYILQSDGYDGSIVKKALDVLIERYPTLRTNIQLGKQRKLLLTERSMSELGSFETVVSSSEVIELKGSEVIGASKIDYKFNLQSGPLICGIISPASTGGEVLQLTVHHIAADDASAGRLANDFVVIYEALLESKAPNLTSVSFPFSKFILEQEKKISEGYFDDDATQLSTLLQSRCVRPDKTLEASEEGLGDAEFALPFSLGSQEHTAFTENLAALAYALSLSLNKREFVFCSHVSLQRDTQDSPQVGMFINLVPILTGYDPSHSSSEHVQRVANDLAESMSRSDIPFELVKNSNEELQKLKKYPFDAYVNELVFDEKYLPRYEPLVVPRTFATDSNVLSVTLLKIDGKESIKIEAPSRQSAPSMQDLQRNITSFLGSIHMPEGSG